MKKKMCRRFFCVTNSTNDTDNWLNEWENKWRMKKKKIEKTEKKQCEKKLPKMTVNLQMLIQSMTHLVKYSHHTTPHHTTPSHQSDSLFIWLTLHVLYKLFGIEYHKQNPNRSHPMVYVCTVNAIEHKADAWRYRFPILWHTLFTFSQWIGTNDHKIIWKREKKKTFFSETGKFCAKLNSNSGPKLKVRPTLNSNAKLLLRN